MNEPPELTSITLEKGLSDKNKICKISDNENAINNSIKASTLFILNDLINSLISASYLKSFLKSKL